MAPLRACSLISFSSLRFTADKRRLIDLADLGEPLIRLAIAISSDCTNH